MGRQVKNFRQSKRAGNADTTAKNYAQVNRAAWHQRVINYVITRGKGGKQI